VAATGAGSGTEWSAAAERLERWLVERDLRGWDPYDALASPLVRALAPGRWGKVAWTQLLRRSPIQLRGLLGVPRLPNPKADALVLESRLRRSSGSARELVDKLEGTASAEGGWGYPFAAGSPEAKGRVERSHGTHQDRMVKKMRRKKIATHAAVNEYLEQEYCDDHNRRFAVDAASEADYHLPAPGVRRLREIFRLETQRVVGNDWVVRHENRFYQVEAQSRHHAPAKSTVTVCEWEDGTLEIHYRGRKLNWHAIEERPGKPVSATRKPRSPFTPPAAHMPHHPWRRSYQDMQPRPVPGAASDQVSRASACAPP
jgi:hypothetical protein